MFTVMPYLYLDCLLVVSSFVHNPVNVAAPSGFETGLRTDRTEVTSTFLVACKLIKKVIEKIPLTFVCLAPPEKWGR